MIKLIKIIYFIFLSLYFLFFQAVNAQEKIKIGLLVPMTGNNKQIGESIIKAVSLAKPSGSKGVYMKKITLSSSMGPGVKIDTMGVV